MATHVLRVPVSTGDANLPITVRDDLIKDDSGGVRFIGDLGFGWSYPAGNLPRPAPSDPASGDKVRDVAELEDGQSVGLAGALNIQYLGGGFDFENCATANREVGIEIPASVSADIFPNQEYLFCVYMKLPSLANWNPTANIHGMVTACDAGKTFLNDTEIFVIAQQKPTAVNGILNVRFQNAAGTVGPNFTISLPSGTDFYDDAVVQLAVWVVGGVATVRAKTVTQSLTSSSAFSGNSEDFSAKTIKVGGSASGFAAAPLTDQYNYRVYRTWVENLAQSGRDPISVLDADFERVIARGVFS